jgi:hypothetical protein
MEMRLFGLVKYSSSGGIALSSGRESQLGAFSKLNLKEEKPRASGLYNSPSGTQQASAKSLKPE